MMYAGIAVLACIAAIFFVRDAKKFMDNRHSLSKLDISLRYALLFLENVILKNGRMIFIKSLSPKFKAPKIPYEALTHAKVLYTLYLCEKLVPITALKQKRFISSRFFLRTYLKQLSNDICVILSSPDGEEDYSATAYAICAFSNMYKTNVINLETLYKLGDYLIANFSPEHTGVAALAMLTIYQYDKQEKWLEAAKNILTYYENPEFDELFNIATEKLLTTEENNLTDDEKNLLLGRMVTTSVPLLEKQIDDTENPRHGAFSNKELPLETAQKIDGLISVYNCIELDDVDARMAFLRVISRGAEYLRHKQTQRDKPKGAIPTYPEWRTIGVPAETRTETVNATLSVWVKFLFLFKN